MVTQTETQTLIITEKIFGETIMAKQSIDKFLNQILCEDSLKKLKEIPSNTIDLVITSPPYYKQREYGKGIGNEKTVEEFLENLLQIFHECVRVVKKEGSIVFNLGDTYENGNLLLVPYRFALEVLKREPIILVNNITWVKLNPTPRQFNRRLVSSTEPFFHFVKSKEYYYKLDIFMQHTNSKKKNNGNANNIGKKYFELIASSSLSKDEQELAKNELEKTIQEVKAGKITSFRMKIRGIHSMPFGGQEGGRKTQILKKGFTIIKIYGNSLKRDIIECSVEAIKGRKHPAIYPEYIIQELLMLLTKKDSVVLDPFIGSGTTAIACKKLGRNYIGIDINPPYCEYARERLQKVKYESSLIDFL